MKPGHLLSGLVLATVGCARDQSSPMTDNSAASMTPVAAQPTGSWQNSVSSSRAPQRPWSSGDMTSTAGVGGAVMMPAAQAVAAPTTTSMATAGAMAPSTAPGSRAMQGGACDTLQSCCKSLTDPSLRSTCEAVVASRAENACTPLVGMLCSGPSQLPTTTPPVAGTAATAPSVDACSALSGCCATLDEEDQEDCQGVVDEADAMGCMDTQAELCPDPNAPAPTPGDD